MGRFLENIRFYQPAGVVLLLCVGVFLAIPVAAAETGLITVTSPSAGSSLSGTVIFTAATLESANIIAVQFLVDGNNAGSETAKIPFSISYDVSVLTNGTHIVSAKGRNSFGTSFTAPEISVTVNNPLPLTIDNLSASVGATSAILTWTTSRPTTFQLDYGITYGYGSAVVSPQRSSSHKVTLARLGPDTKYRARVRVWDKDFISAVKPDFDFTTSKALGLAALPKATLLTSQTGHSVTGTVVLTAVLDPSISLNGEGTAGFDGVQFLVDGIDIGDRIQKFPLQASYDTRNLDNGSHTFAAMIWDKFGNSAMINSIPVTVANSATAPAVTAVSSSNAKLINASGTFYLVNSGKRYGITDPGVLGSFGFEFKDANLASTADLAMPVGSLLAPGDGSLVKKKDNSTVWLITSGKKYGFTSADAYLGLGFAWKNVREVSAEVLDPLGEGQPISSSAVRHPAGVFVLDGGTIYRMEENIRQGIPSLEVYNSWNIDNDFSHVVPANAADLAVSVGPNLESRVFN